MAQIIFSQTRGAGNRNSYYIIDSRIPAMQIPAFYVTDEKFATRMDRTEADQRIAGNAELRALINIGNVTVEEVAA